MDTIKKLALKREVVKMLRVNTAIKTGPSGGRPSFFSDGPPRPTRPPEEKKSNPVVVAGDSP